MPTNKQRSYMLKRHRPHLVVGAGLLFLGAVFISFNTVHAGPITGGAGNPPYTKLAVYQGVVSIVPGGQFDNLLEIGNGGRDIAGTGSIFIRPDSLNSASINYAEFYKDIGNRASLKVPGTLSIGTQKNHTIGTIISPDTQAKTYEIARIGFDQNNWSYNSAVYITLDQNFWGSGGQKKYVIRAGFNENTGIARLIEANGQNDVIKEVKVRISGPFQNGTCNVGGPPNWLPCLKYIRVFADVDFYTRWDVRVSHSMTDTSNAIPGAAQIRIFTDGTSGNDWNLNIASFDSSEAVVNEFTNTFNQNVNVAGSVCFGAPTFTDCHNTWTDLSSGPGATQHWTDDGAIAETTDTATIGVTRGPNPSNLSYIGLTRQSSFRWGIGIAGSDNSFIIGPAQAAPSTKTIPTPHLAVGSGGGVTVPTGNLTVTTGNLTIGGVALARSQLPNAMSFGATSNATMAQGVGSYAFLSPLLNNGSYNNLSQNGDSGLFYSDASGFVIGPWASSNEGIRIGATGNVGIGEAPNGLWKLQVNGAAVATMFIDRDWSQRNIDPSGNSRIENLQLEQLLVNDYRNISAAPDVVTNNWNWVTLASRSYNVGNGGMRLDPSPDNAWYSVQLDPVKHPLVINFETWTDDAGICVAGFYDSVRDIWYTKMYVGRYVNVVDLDLDAGFQASDISVAVFPNDGNYSAGFNLNEMHGGRNNTGASSSQTFGWMKRVGLDRMPPGLTLYYKLGYASPSGNSGVNCTISIVYSET